MVPDSAYFVGDKALQDKKFLVHIFGLSEFNEMKKSSAPRGEAAAAKSTARGRGRGRGKARGAKLPR